MNGYRLIPCLLMRDGGLYKTEKFDSPTYVGDPLNVLRIFNDKEVDEIAVLDIGAPRTSASPDFELVARLAGECFMPLCYGGGVRTISDFRRLFDLGVEKVSITTAAVEDRSLIEEAAKIFGTQSVVVGIDVRRHRKGFAVMTKAGTAHSGIGAVDHARIVEEAGAGEILLTSIDQEGTRSGFDLELIGEVSSAVGVPVVANGGAGSLADCAEAVAAGASAVAAGSLFVFHGRRKAVLISYPTEEERLRTFEPKNAEPVAQDVP